MGQTLTNGLYLPDEGERNCYSGLESNWRALDAVIGGYNTHIANLDIHVTAADKTGWNGHVANGDIHVTAADKTGWNGHVVNSDIHVTAADKTNWNGKADDTGVMHLTGDESSTGKKTFGDMATFDGSYLGNEASTNARTEIVLESNQDTHGQSGIYITKFRQNKAQGALSGNDVVYLTLDLLENSVRTNTIFRFNFRDFVDNVPQDIAFYPTGAKNSLGGSAGGSSNNKWHLFNGLNPGALSLPNLSAGVDISAYITDITGASNINKFTPTADGWVSIGLSNADFIEIYIPSSLIGGSFTKSTVNNYGLAFMPVIANKEVRFALKGASIGWAKYYPCQGNV